MSQKVKSCKSMVMTKMPSEILEDSLRRVCEQLQDSRDSHDRCHAENIKLKATILSLQTENEEMAQRISEAVFEDEHDPKPQRFESKVDHCFLGEVVTYEP